MSDLFARNSTYFTAPIYNASTTQDLVANFDITQISALVSKASDYQVALDKAKLPINVPLTPYNIPFKQYAVILQSKTAGGDVVYSGQSFVRQVGTTVTTQNFLYNIDTTTNIFTKYTYIDSTNPNLIAVNTYSLPTGSYGPVVVDGFENVYVASNPIAGQLTYSELSIFSSSGALLTSYGFSSIKNIAISPNQNIYVAESTLGVSSVKKFINTNTHTSVTLVLNGTIYNCRAGTPLINVSTISVDDQVLVFWNNAGTTTMSLYDTTLLAVSDTPLPTLLNPEASSFLSESGNYAVSDNLTGVDLVFGLQTGGNIATATGVILAAGSTFTSCPFITGDGSQPTALTWGTASGNTDVGTFNNNSNPTITGISTPGTTPYMSNLFQANEGGLFGGLTNSSQTYWWNLAGSITNEWYLIDTTSNINGSLKASLQKQYGYDSPLFTLTENGSLYKTTKPWYSNVLYSARQNADIGAYINLWGFDTNVDTASPLEGSLVLNISGMQDFSLGGGLFKVANNLYSMSQYVGGTMYFNQTEINTGNTNQTYISGFELNNTQIAYSGGSPDVSYALIGTSIYTQQYSLYYFSSHSDTTGTLLKTYPLSFHPMMASVEIEGVYYVYVMDGLNGNVEEWDFSTRTLSYTYSFDAELDVGYSNMVAIYITGTTNIYAVGATGNLIKYVLNPSPTQTILADGFLPGSPIAYNISTNQVTVASNTAVGGLVIVNLNGSIQATAVINGADFSAPNQSNTFYYGDTLSYVYDYTQISYTLPLTGNITSFSFSKTDPTIVYMLSSADSKIYVGTYTGTSIVNIVPYALAGSSTFLSIGNYPNNFETSTQYLFSLTSPTPISTSAQQSTSCKSIGRNGFTDASSGGVFNGEFTMGYKGVGVTALSGKDFSVKFSKALPSTGRIFTNSGFDVSAGNVDIWTYSTLINAINAALALANTDVCNKGGQLAPTNPPTVTLDYATGYATLSYPTEMANVAGNNILFSDPLLQILYFDSVKDIVFAGYNDIILPNTSPASTSITQNVLSLWNFNQLDKILFISNALFTLGADIFNNANSLNTIADFDVHTNEPSYGMNNISNVLYIVPQIYNPLVLASNSPLVRIQIQIYYQLLDGTLYPLTIPPLQNATMKMIFGRRF